MSTSRFTKCFGSTAQERITSIITVSQGFNKEGSCNLNYSDINELLVDPKLFVTGLIHLMSETNPDGECYSHYEAAYSFTGEYLYKVLQLSKELRISIINTDLNIR